MRHSSLKALATVVLGLPGLMGCGAPEVSESVLVEPVDTPIPADASYQSWQEVWSVEVAGKEVSSRKVGYLVKSFTEEDPAGRFLVQDLLWDTRGFLLAEGKAFVLEGQSSTAGELTSRDLGNTGFQNGVKRILKVTGEVQFRPPTRPKAETVEGSQSPGA